MYSLIIFPGCVNGPRSANLAAARGREMAVRRKKGLGQGRRQAFVFLAGFFHHPAPDQVLQLFVSAQTQHFLAAAGRIPGPQILVQNLKELFELERCPAGKDRNQFLSNEIRHSA